MPDEKYLALYRKYRPNDFDDVRGRDAIVRTLKNQIISGRIGHSYLFCGTRGTGKTTIARIFARAANCENQHDGNPCGECPTCRAIQAEANLNGGQSQRDRAGCGVQQQCRRYPFHR